MAPRRPRILRPNGRVHPAAVSGSATSFAEPPLPADAAPTAAPCSWSLAATGGAALPDAFRARVALVPSPSTALRTAPATTLAVAGLLR